VINAARRAAQSNIGCGGDVVWADSATRNIKTAARRATILMYNMYINPTVPRCAILQFRGGLLVEMRQNHNGNATLPDRGTIVPLTLQFSHIL
jgi:RNase P/RNase MRP subunit p29